MFGGALKVNRNLPRDPLVVGRTAILLKLARVICELRLEGWDQEVPANVKQMAEAHYNIKIKRVENVRTRTII